MTSRFSIFISILLFSVSLSAQSTLPRIYDYDDAGNRILRKTIELKNSETSANDTLYSSSLSDDDNFFEDKICDNNVKVYPNPAKDVVTIQFENPISCGSYKLTNLSGQIIEENSYSSSIFRVDLSRYVSGVYLLIIKTGGKTETLQIIKK